ncbi:hypothetical protein MGM1_0210 [Candidatus Malacoplasma girerdii]|uniref:Uncharacterized protein n=1 Tax=Candidatus Malacoplasma girerdii TaxID=1318617 RepID=A0A097SS34_9BACT|nr:hypothetical protein MGM1_0210 [Candidatus Malacoplasma girerdii]ASJ88930.1 MAG: hypothetical protein B1217_0021 [Candidatus Malacoplasma girerdii]
MNFACIVGAISSIDLKKDKSIIWLKNKSTYFNNQIKQEEYFKLPVKVDSLIFKKQLELMKEGIKVALKCRLEFNGGIELNTERITFIDDLVA